MFSLSFGKKESNVEVGAWIIIIQICKKLNISPEEFVKLLEDLEGVDDYMKKMLSIKLSEDK